MVGALDVAGMTIYLLLIAPRNSRNAKTADFQDQPSNVPTKAKQ